MSIREDRVNELIKEISSMKQELIDEQVALIESYFVNGHMNNKQGVFTMLKDYLEEISKSIAGMSYDSRMNSGINETIYAICKIIDEVQGDEERPGITMQFANKARAGITEKVESQIKEAIAIIKDTSLNNVKIEEENAAIENITEEQRANRTKKLKTENINKGCNKLENAIRIIKINRRPFDNIVINNKAIKEALEVSKLYLYNISKNAMHSMYKGIMIAQKVESLNAELTNPKNLANLNSSLNKKDEVLIKTLINKYKELEAEIDFMQHKPKDTSKKQSAITKVLFSEDLSLNKIQL